MASATWRSADALHTKRATRAMTRGHQRFAQTGWSSVDKKVLRHKFSLNPLKNKNSAASCMTLTISATVEALNQVQALYSRVAGDFTRRYQLLIQTN